MRWTRQEIHEGNLEKVYWEWERDGRKKLKDTFLSGMM